MWVAFRTSVVMALVVTIGFSIRLYVAQTMPAGGDSGIYLYWADLVNNGETPYRDFFLRDPLYVYLVAISTRLLGANYLAISMVSVLPSVGTALLLYAIGRDLFGDTVGVLAGVIFSMAPTVIWYGTVDDPRSLMLFLSTCSMLVLSKYLRKGRIRLLFAYGVILGLSTFVYRGVAIYIVTLPLLLVFVNYSKGILTSRHLAAVLERAFVALGSYALTAGVLFTSLSLTSSFAWMASSFGFGGQQESAAYFIWGEVAGPPQRLRIFHVAVREWLFLLAPAGLFLLSVLAGATARRRGLTLPVISLAVSSFLIAAIIYRENFPLASFGAYEPAEVYLWAFAISLIIFMAAGATVFRQASRMAMTMVDQDRAKVIPVFWFLSTATLVALFGVPLVNYYSYFAPVLTLAAAVAVSALMGAVRNGGHFRIGLKPLHLSAVLFLGMILGSSIVTASMLADTPMTWRDQYIPTVERIASYIEARTGPQDEILTVNPAVALYAHRKLALGITQIQLYGKTGTEPFDPMPYDPFDLVPGVEEISREMGSGRVKYVVDSNGLLYTIGLHKLWEDSFERNFHFETTIDGVTLFAFN